MGFCVCWTGGGIAEWGRMLVPIREGSECVLGFVLLMCIKGIFRYECVSFCQGGRV